MSKDLPRPAWAQALDRNKEIVTLPLPADDEITVDRYQQWLIEMGEANINEQMARSRLDKMCSDGLVVMVGLRKNIKTNRPTNAYKFVEEATNGKAQSAQPPKKSKNGGNKNR